MGREALPFVLVKIGQNPIRGTVVSKKRNMWWFFPLLGMADCGFLFIQDAP
jgi:hypothetical protein